MLAIYVILVLPIGTALYVTACLLPTRWLGYYGLGVCVCLVQYWHDSRHDPEVGLAMVFVVMPLVVFAGTATVTGIAARLAIAFLRSRGICRRYAWLPAPILYLGLATAPFFTDWGLLRP